LPGSAEASERRPTMEVPKPTEDEKDFFRSVPPKVKAT
jgi:hypothetical protein